MSEFKPIMTQEDFDAAIGSRIKRERETVSKEYLTQLDEANKKIAGYEKQIADHGRLLDEANKKMADHDKTVADLNAKIKGYESSSVKTRIAHETGLPYELAGRLSGETEEDIRKDAEGLCKLIGQHKGAPPLASTERGVPENESRAALKSMLDGLKGE